MLFTLSVKMQIFHSTPLKAYMMFLWFPTCRVLTLSVVFQTPGTSLTWLPEPAAGGWKEGLSWKQATGMGHGAGSNTGFEKLSLIAVLMS